MVLPTLIPQLPYSLPHWPLHTVVQPSSSLPGTLQQPLLGLPASHLAPSNSLSTFKPESFFFFFKSCNSPIQKTLLAFLCQLNKTPEFLAGCMIPTLHSLNPACPSILSHIPCWPHPLHMPHTFQVPGLCPRCCLCLQCWFPLTYLAKLQGLTTCHPLPKQPRSSFTGPPLPLACSSLIMLVSLGGVWCLSLCLAP